MTIPALGSYGKAVVRSAMEMRIAKLAIGLRLNEMQNGRWPKSIDELESRSIDVGLRPIEPIGPKPFGYRITNGKAEVWGFNPENAGDMTPEEPVDPLTGGTQDAMSFQDHQQEIWEYWHWELPAED